MTTPTPDEVRRSLRRSVEDVPHLLAEYRWVHGYAYSKDNRSEALEGTNKHKGDPNDPTSAITVHGVPSKDGHRAKGKENARRALSKSWKSIENAIAELRAAEAWLAHAIPDRDIAPTVQTPGTVTREELRLAREAQERRKVSGEAIP